MKKMQTTNRFVCILLAAASAFTAFGCGSSSTNPGVTGGPTGVGAPYPSGPRGAAVPLDAAKNFAFLSKLYPRAVANPVPWAGYWWPYQQNGIATSASKYEAADPSAPGGAASWEAANHGLGLASPQDWWGHCNGWSAAAVLAAEPRDSSSVGGVPFSVADKKALLSETYMEVSGDILGTRVNDPNDFSSPAFADVVPAQFYLMFVHMLAIQKRSFVFDRYTGYQVWNQPAVAYQTDPITKDDYLGPDPQAPHIYRINVTTTIWWTDDNVDPNILTPAFDPNSDVFPSRVLKYELWLDAPVVFDDAGNITSSGNIVLTEQNGYTVGGRWKTSYLPLANSYPDYMWVPSAAAPASGFKNPKINDAWVLSNMK